MPPPPPPRLTIITTSTTTLLLFITLILSPPSSSSSSTPILCSSLQGPFCAPINGLYPPRHAPPTMSTTSDKTLGEVLADLLKAHGRAFFGNQPITRKPLTPEEIDEVKTSKGVFRITGTVDNKHAAVRFNPANKPEGTELWLVKPPAGWVGVGGSGTYDANKDVITLTLLEESTGKPHTKCSNLILNRVASHADDTRDETLELALRTYPTAKDILASPPSNKAGVTGVWKGTYSCTGSRTHAIVVLRENPIAKHELSGTFTFEALSFPGRSHTQSGCACLSTWRFLDVTINGGRCARPKPLSRHAFCYIEPDTCFNKPAGREWDYCDESEVATSSLLESSIPSSPVVRKTSFAVNDRVAARWKGFAVYYMGRISRVNRDGTYGIAYDDGDVEDAVPVTLIRDVADLEGVDERVALGYDENGNIELILNF